MTLLQYLSLLIAAFLGGSVNAIAGGGTVFSFTTLVLAGIPPTVASATNSLALWPASVGGAFAFRDDVRRERRSLLIMLVPSLLGGLGGAWLLTATPEALLRLLAPFLVLFATLLFAGRTYFTYLAQRQAGYQASAARISPWSYVGGVVFQFVVALYGGYFGAGIGILMLSSFSIMGMKDIHRMNAIKNVCAAALNGIAIIYLALAGKILWPLALMMGVAAVVGGYVTARYAKRINQRALRIFIIGMGILASAYLFWRAMQ